MAHLCARFWSARIKVNSIGNHERGWPHKKILVLLRATRGNNILRQDGKDANPLGRIFLVETFKSLVYHKFYSIERNLSSCRHHNPSYLFPPLFCFEKVSMCMEESRAAFKTRRMLRTYPISSRFFRSSLFPPFQRYQILCWRGYQLEIDAYYQLLLRRSKLGLLFVYFVFLA